jgi:glyoxylase-like metal-dependent hydrolase (beta-lactamase superfamily II)
MRIHCFSTGAVRVKRGDRGMRRYFRGGWCDQTLPVNVFAVEHPAGVCLFDAGQTAEAARPGYFPGWYPFFRLARFELEPADEAAAQLRSIGSDPRDVRWVVLSHLHTDHVGGIAPFGHAEVVVSRTEWERARGLPGRLRGYLPQYWPSAVMPRLVDFAGDPLGPFPASHDLAGDARLVLVPMPGHTPGHIGLLVRAGNRDYLCGGDLAESGKALANAAPEIADFCRREGVIFLATHDPQAGVLADAGRP